jgi:hypothetical protein
MADGDTSLRDLYQKDARTLTDDDVRRIRESPEDDAELMRMSGTAHVVPIVEAMRRLREAILKEERAIKWLNGALLAFTVALFALAAAEFWRH